MPVNTWAGLTTLYRDKTYLAMEEEQQAKRMLVLSKSLGSAWIKTEAQAIIDRAKVLHPAANLHSSAFLSRTRERAHVAVLHAPALADGS